MLLRSALSHFYNLEGERVLPVLPDEVAEEYDEEVIIGTDETAEQTNELNGPWVTTMSSSVISMRWSVILSTALLGSISVIFK